MAKHKLDIETYWTDSAPNATVIIRRHDDNKYFDWYDKKFKNEKDCKTLNVPLKVAGKLGAMVSIDPDPTEWIDSGYTIYYLDMTTPGTFLYYMKTIYFPLCDPTTAEVAGRTLDCIVPSHKNKDSVGSYLMNITDRLDRIEKKLNGAIGP
jgi:hypothetical protein